MFMILLGVGMGIGAGATSAIARKIGANDRKSYFPAITNAVPNFHKHTRINRFRGKTIKNGLFPVNASVTIPNAMPGLNSSSENDGICRLTKGGMCMKNR